MPSSGLLKFCYMPVILMCTALSGCEAPTESGSVLSGVASGRLWATPDVSLCFDEQNSKLQNFDQYMERFKAVIQREYTKEKTYFQWTGLEKCQDMPDAMASILLVDDYPQSAGLAGIASQIGQFKSPMGPMERQIFAGTNRPSVSLSIASGFRPPGGTPEQHLDYTMLHELGHLAGLFHEHAHPQSTCNATQESANDKYQQFSQIDAQDAYVDHGSAYDPDSIMSYCVGYSLADGRKVDQAQTSVPQIVGLSPGDQSFLRQIYNAPSSEATTFAAPVAIATSYPQFSGSTSAQARPTGPNQNQIGPQGPINPRGPCINGYQPQVDPYSGELYCVPY